ncbi:hypothetical protein JCM16138_11270 [Thermococcus atlanticus]
MGKAYFTIDEFSRAFMIPEGEVLWAITWGKLKAEKVNGKLMIPRSEVLKILRRFNPYLTEKDLNEWGKIALTR